MIEKAADAGVELDDDAAARVVGRVKDLEHAGYQFEAADGSFELLLRKEAGTYEPLFRLESWRAIVEKRADGKVETEATIKIWVGGERYVRTAEGNGPVNALDNGAARGDRRDLPRTCTTSSSSTSRSASSTRRSGTGAVTRVLLDASDGREAWGSIGVSENVIEASWEALVDSLELAMQPARVLPALMDEPIPLARPVLGAEEERAVAEVLRSGQLSLGPRLPAFERGLRRPPRRPARQRGLQRHGRPAPRAARRRRARRRRGRSRRRCPSWPAPTSIALRARHAGLRRHRPGHAQPRPRRRGGRR